MEEHGSNASGRGNLQDLLTQLENRWGRMVELVGRLREENTFLQEQLRDREERSVQLEGQHQEAQRRLEDLLREKDQLAVRLETLLAQMNTFENTH
ncbi:MAG: hypothetical protein HQL77_01575 [Magnetococcales bacterium]|nr:hypothetical protein [Magnetococcales bacterium]MBF0434042.1 hypothetical protein [Magnetococcales bacterium]